MENVFLVLLEQHAHFPNLEAHFPFLITVSMCCFPQTCLNIKFIQSVFLILYIGPYAILIWWSHTMFFLTLETHSLLFSHSP